MSPSQEVLRAWLVHNYRQAGVEEHGIGDFRAVVIVRDLEPVTFIADVLRYAHALAPELAVPWRRSFTRTVFFAGRPASLADRFTYRHVAADQTAAWLDPAPAEDTRNVSRALRLFQGTAVWPGESPPARVRVPGAVDSGRTAELRIACDRLTAAEYLVHVHHVVAEAALRGLVRPGDALDVTHVASVGLDDLDPTDDRLHLRVAPDSAGDGDLRLFAYLRRTS